MARSTKGAEMMDVKSSANGKPFGKEIVIIKSENGKKIMLDIDSRRGEAS